MFDAMKAALGFGQRDNAPDPNFSTREAGYLLTRADGSSTIDEATRSVEFVLSTERAVPVWDYRNWRAIDEVLLSDSIHFAGGEPLLDSHNRSSVDFIRGSVRDIRKEAGQVVGRVYFSKADEASRTAWEKVREGHVNAGSVGYIVKKAAEIPAGQKATVAGREWTAGDMPLRVVTEWQLREFSLVPVGADDKAKMRAAMVQPTNGGGAASERQLKEETEMKFSELARRALVALGLATDADEATTRSFYDGLGKETQETIRSLNDAATEPVEGQRNATAPTSGGQGEGMSAEAINRAIADGIAAERAAERDRATAIRAEGAAYSIPSTVVERAITEGKSVADARALFLQNTQNSRAEGVHGGVHIGSTSNDVTREALTVGLMQRAGVAINANSGVQVTGNGGTRNTLTGEALDRAVTAGEQMRGMSLFDIARHACAIDAQNGVPGALRTMPLNRDEMIRGAVSGSALSAIFTDSVNASMVRSYEDYPDSTQGLVRESTANDFKSHDRIAVGKTGALTRLARGGEADHTQIDTESESARIYRFAEQFSVDEQDIIDDRMDILSDMPREMANAAARLRPDLVYYTLLKNAVMRDSVALFDASTHKNYGTTSTALAAGTLQAAIAAMAKQRYTNADGKTVPLNIAPKYLIVPQDLYFTAQVLLQSAERVIAADSGGTYNPLRNMLEVRVDDRLGVAGVIDPITGTVQAGTATNWFLAADPNIARTIEVLYLGGQKSPTLRSFTFDQGRYGIGWDIKHDIGVKALDWRGLYKATGAS